MIEAKLIFNRTRGGAPLFGCEVEKRVIYFTPVKRTYEEGATFARDLTLGSDILHISPESLPLVKAVYYENKEFVQGFFDSLVYGSSYPQIKYLTRYAALRLNSREQERLDLAKSRITNVYLIRDKATGYVKIGRSRDPEARFRQLVKQDTLMPKPNEFEPLFFWPAYALTEQILHDAYAEKRIRGEWFELTDAAVEEIKKNYFNQD